MKDTEIVATGPELIGLGYRAIEPVIEEMLLNAKRWIHIMSFVFTPSAMHILELLEVAAQKGVDIKIVINRLGRQDKGIRYRLEQLKATYPDYVTLVDFRDPNKRQLHAKVLVIDRKIAFVGSANLSWGGMTSNYEIGIIVHNSGAWELANLIDSFAKHAVKN